MAEEEADGGLGIDESPAGDEVTGTEEADDEAGGKTEDEAGGKAESDRPAFGGGLDVEAERGRLDEVGEQIEQGRRALADREGDTDPEPDGPPIAEGEGAANAPPG